MQKTLSPSEVPKKIIQYVTMRWWSTWNMLKRLSELSAPIDALIAYDEVKVRNLTAAQKVIVTEIGKVLLPMAITQRFLEGQQYSTASIVPFCLWKIRNTLRETSESNEVSPSTRHIANILYEDFTTKLYGDGTQVFHDNVVIGANKRYISLHKIILVTTIFDPRMKELSPFLNDNDVEENFEYLLELMDDDLDKFSDIDYGLNHKLTRRRLIKINI